MNLMDLTAVELGKKIKSGETSAVEAAKESIASINKLESKINAFVTVIDEKKIFRSRR